MKKLSLAEAKARISELVDEAEHRGKRVIILRHGKPAAAIVPVAVAMPPRKRPRRVSDSELDAGVQAFVDEFSGLDSEVSAVEDLLASRR